MADLWALAVRRTSRPIGDSSATISGARREGRPASGRGHQGRPRNPPTPVARGGRLDARRPG
jgi:hypothetical protein